MGFHVGLNMFSGHEHAQKSSIDAPGACTLSPASGIERLRIFINDVDRTDLVKDRELYKVN